MLKAIFTVISLFLIIENCFVYYKRHSLHAFFFFVSFFPPPVNENVKGNIFVNEIVKLVKSERIVSDSVI